MKTGYYLLFLFVAVVTAPKPEIKQDAKELGLDFVKMYYEGAIRGPDGVMEFFGDNSVYVGANGKEAHGLEDIRNVIGNLNLQEGKILVVSINAAFTGNGGIMVQSIANYIVNSKTYAFTESFYLVSQAKGWYARSCVFKWHDESPDEQHNHELVNGHTEVKKHESERGRTAKRRRGRTVRASRQETRLETPIFREIDLTSSSTPSSARIRIPPLQNLGHALNSDRNSEQAATPENAIRQLFTAASSIDVPISRQHHQRQNDVLPSEYSSATKIRVKRSLEGCYTSTERKNLRQELAGASKTSITYAIENCCEKIEATMKNSQAFHVVSQNLNDKSVDAKCSYSWFDLLVVTIALFSGSVGTIVVQVFMAFCCKK